jgi:hypothetical protein
VQGVLADPGKILAERYTLEREIGRGEHELEFTKELPS